MPASLSPLLLKDLLKTAYGFLDKDILVMVDTDPKAIQPTGKNIKAKLAEMVTSAADGDELVFHFSGHGTQVETRLDRLTS